MLFVLFHSPSGAAFNGPANGKVAKKKESFTDGEMQVIICDAGFTPVGPTSATCTAGNPAAWVPDLISTVCGKYNDHYSCSDGEKK